MYDKIHYNKKKNNKKLNIHKTKKKKIKNKTKTTKKKKRIPVREKVQFSRSVVSDSLWPHGLQHARPPCPSPTPRACSNSRPSRRWWKYRTRSRGFLGRKSSRHRGTGVEEAWWAQEMGREPEPEEQWGWEVRLWGRQGLDHTGLDL